MSGTSLVLGGGGARGAYEAGVLRYIFERIPAETGQPIRFSSIVGTSAGAINAAFLAAWAHDLATGARVLCERWASLSIPRVYRIGMRQLWRVQRSLFKASEDGGSGEVALVDASPLHELLRAEVDWERLQKNLEEGHLDVFSVVATELATSRSVVFFQDGGRYDVDWESHNPYVRPRNVQITADHVLASAAIPLLFPPVEIDGRWYIDGGLGMNTPVRPALRFGADKLLVVSVRKHLTVFQGERIARERGRNAPTWAQVVGKTMNAVLLDRANHEVERIERVNEILRWGTQRYGEEFAVELGRLLHGERGAPWREIDPMLVDPSSDLGALAADFVRREGFAEDADEVTRRVLRFLAQASQTGENDALSYLMFDPPFLAELLELGWADARERHDELVEFFKRP